MSPGLLGVEEDMWCIEMKRTLHRWEEEGEDGEQGLEVRKRETQEERGRD